MRFFLLFNCTNNKSFEIAVRYLNIPATNKTQSKEWKKIEKWRNKRRNIESIN